MRAWIMSNAFLRYRAGFICIALFLGGFGCSNVTTLPGDNTNDNSSIDDGNDNSTTDTNTNDNGTTDPNLNDNGALDTNTNDNGTTDTNTNDNGTLDTNTNDNGAIDGNTDDNGTTDTADACGNDIGNGDEVIAGPSEPGEADRDSVFRSLTVHPADVDILWVGSERNGILKSTDGGTTWMRQRSGLRHTNGLYPEVWDLAVSKSNPDILLAATLDSSGPVTGDYPSSIAGVYKSTDGGENWIRKNCGIDSSKVNSVRFDPTDPNVMMAGIEGGTPSFTSLADQHFAGGLYRSTDGGENWTAIAIDANDGRNGFWHLKVRDTSPATFITFGMNYETLSENHGFLRSADAGRTWTKFASEFAGLLISNFDVSTDGTTLYFNARDSFAIQVSTDSGATWKEVSHHSANGPIAVSPSDPQLVLFGGTNDLNRSSDGLATTTSVLTAAATIEDIAFAPGNPNIVYVGAVGLLIYKSIDAGQTFTLIADLRNDVLNAP